MKLQVGRGRVGYILCRPYTLSYTFPRSQATHSAGYTLASYTLRECVAPTLHTFECGDECVSSRYTLFWPSPHMATYSGGNVYIPIPHSPATSVIILMSHACACMIAVRLAQHAVCMTRGSAAALIIDWPHRVIIPTIPHCRGWAGKLAGC